MSPKRSLAINMGRKRKRGTAIVETDKGILIVSHSRHGQLTYMLPGGRVKKGEQSICAAIRELHEETGLYSLEAKYLFDLITKHHKHKVYLIKTCGRLRKRHETTRIRFYNDSTKDKYKFAWHVKPIIEKYFKRKERK